MDTCWYDTSKDSDGGAWIHRTAELSYGKEARPAGRYLGQQASVTAAAAVTGAVVGDWYYNTTSKTFRELTATGTPADQEIFRAGSAHFPSQVLVVAEAARVILFDASSPELTMWMVLKVGLLSTVQTILGYSGPITSVAITEADLLVARNVPGGNYGGLTRVNFYSERTFIYSPGYSGAAASYTGVVPYPISDRHKDNLVFSGSNSDKAIVNVDVNDVAMTVLPTAPIDPQTGLKVPTIAVATDGGVSVIKDDGSVVSGTVTNVSWRVRKVLFEESGTLYGGSSSALYGASLQVMSESPYTTVTKIGGGNNGFPFIGALPGPYGENILWPTTINHAEGSTPVAHKSSIFLGGQMGVDVIKHNPTDPAKGMVAHITDKKNTGWMVGDIQGAWLCDNVAGAISAPELVTNGTFDTDLTGWSNLQGTIMWDAAGKIRVDSNGNYYGGTQNIAVTVGKTYLISWVGEIGNSTPRMRLGVPGEGLRYLNLVSDGFRTATITATGPTLAINLSTAAAAGYCYFDNISVKEVVADHSGNANHLNVVGTLNRATIGNGEIAAWSGFDTTNYLTATVPTGGDIYGWEEKAGTWTFCKTLADFTGISETGGTLTINGGDKLALLRYSLTAPSADQIAKMYRDELAMIQGKAVLAGSDPAIKALAYDQERDLLHAASAGTVSSFRGLERVASQVSTVGTISALASDEGVLTVTGSTGVALSHPPVNVREKLAKASRPKTGTQREDFFFTGDGVNPDFVLRRGWKPKRVWVDGNKKREGSNEDYTVRYDGFVYSIRFAVAPANNAEIDMEAVDA